jgi:poly(A) polymerase/tRNA nucleotidyltransferase (CCA-adding enzyme)
MQTTTILKKLNRETLAEVYYAGTFVRDIIRRKSPENLEIIIRNLQLSDLIDYFRRYGDISFISNGEYFLFHPKHNNSKIKISLPRKDSKYNPYFTLRNDGLSRSFTIDAMFLPVVSKIKRNVIDHFGGLRDIRDRKIKAIGNAKQLMRKQPLLMLKAVSLSAEIGYKIDSNLFYAIKSNHSYISKLLKTEIRDEFIKILLSDKPSRYLKILYSLGLLDIIAPELSMCVGVTQNEKYHRYDVFSHCAYACDNTEPNLMLRLSALLHDVGKPQTREEVTNKIGGVKITFYNHEVMGVKLAKKLLKRLKFDPKVITKVADLIYLHMYNFEPNKWTDAAVRRFIKKAKIDREDLKDLANLPIFLIRKADRLANGHSLKAISYRQRLFEKRIKDIYIKSNVLNVNDLMINGNIIIDKFNLKPGPTVGHVLNYLLSVVIEDQKMNTEEALIEAASNYLSEALK